MLVTWDMNSTKMNFLLFGVELWDKEEKSIELKKSWTSISELRH